jgi:hypothetical protein
MALIEGQGVKDQVGKMGRPVDVVVESPADSAVPVPEGREGGNQFLWEWLSNRVRLGNVKAMREREKDGEQRKVLMLCVMTGAWA